MATNIGPKIEVEGESQYKKSLKDIVQETKTLKAEMKALETGFSSETSEMKKSQERTKLLKSEKAALEEKVKLLNSSIDESVKKTGEDSAATKKLEEQLASTRAELENVNKELDRNSGLSAFSRDLTAASTKLQTVGGKITTVGKGLTTTVSAPIMAVGTYALKTAADFDTAMSQVAASMGVQVQDITDIREKALELAGSTVFTTVEVAEGFNILAQAGYDSKKQIATLPAILDLAAAGATSIADAATYVTGALNGFKNETKTAEDYADMIAIGATKAKTDVDSLGAAFSDASSTATMYGQTSETTMKALLGMADANSTGTAAATTLNRVMTDLYAPTDAAQAAMHDLGVSAYDFSTGSARDLFDVVGDINDRMSGMTEEQKNAYLNTIFTTNGLKGFNQISAISSEKMELFNEALGNYSGSASQQANTQLYNMNGSMKKMESAIDVASVKIGDKLTPKMSELADNITDAADAFNSLDDDTIDGIVAVGAALLALGPGVTIIGGLVTNIGKILGVGAGLAALAAAAPAQAAMVVGGLGGVATAAALCYNNYDDLNAGAKSAGEAVKKWFEDTGDNYDTWYETMKTKFETAGTTAKDSFEALKTNASDVWDAIKTTVSDGIDKIKGYLDFEWSLPTIKTPHFSVTGGEAPYGFMGQGSLPSLSVEWYKKGYDQAQILSGPTIFGWSGGSLLGGGEAPGNEIVVGEQHLLALMRETVDSALAAGDNVTNYGGVSINVYASPGMDVNELAEAIEDRLAFNEQRRLAWS